MSKCWYCKTKKGRRYCSPIENILCPTCCAKNRLKNIDCSKDCRYLEGASIHAAREEDKKFINLMSSVPHGQYNDIFKDRDVALVSAEIELFILDYYLNGRIQITDKMVYECYKNLYKIQSENKVLETDELNDLMQRLIDLYDERIPEWLSFIKKDKINQIFLRLMYSIKQISGGIMGEFGYLNFLKNNLLNPNLDGQFIVEDKFKRKSIKSI